LDGSETESEPIFGFPHIPSEQLSLAAIKRQSVKVIWPLPADKSVNLWHEEGHWLKIFWCFEKSPALQIGTF